MITPKRKSSFSDEFYTKYETVEKELSHYDFTGKHVLCNCDDLRKSNFMKYFNDNFDKLGLKRLTVIGYCCTFYFDRTNELNSDCYKYIKDDGSFSSKTSLKFLKECDIVVTNPPFSLWREYFGLLIQNNKDFIILGNYNIINYPDVFKKFMDSTVRFGYNVNQSVEFIVPDYFDEYARKENGTKYSKKVPSISWFTTLPVNKKNKLKLTKQYDPEQYRMYDNYNAIECSKISDIPVDYYGIIGVPITYLSYHDPEQFDILGCSPYYNYQMIRHDWYKDWKEYTVDGNETGGTGGKIVTPTMVVDNPDKNYYSDGKVKVQVMYARIFIAKRM